jgi:DNA-binding transcriptional MerR regulator
VAAGGFTIGEVLNQLKDDFEDITISKIRFLESEGLVFPDRTDSGYRKFSDDDVNRLRFILTAQRDHYLPLKVIREQLERLDAGEVPTAPVPDADLMARPGLAEVVEALDAAMATGAEHLLEPEADAIALSVDELSDATGLTAAEVRSLREYGLIGEDSGATTFGSADLLVARAARELLRMGLEPRHLRMYLQFVDREVSLFEQVVTPLLRQRNPEARARATEQLEQLTLLTGRLKQALLASALRRTVRGA